MEVSQEFIDLPGGVFAVSLDAKALDFWSAGIPRVAGGMISMKHQNGVWEHWRRA